MKHKANVIEFTLYKKEEIVYTLKGIQQLIKLGALPINDISELPMTPLARLYYEMFTGRVIRQCDGLPEPYKKFSNLFMIG